MRKIAYLIFPDAGTYTVYGRVFDKDGGSTTYQATITVVDPPVVATGGFTLEAVAGELSSEQTVATFVDPGGPEALSAYSAVIDWGDGSSSSGTVTLAADGVTFVVTGAHLYDEAGMFSVGVMITHRADIVSETTSSADVTAAGGHSYRPRRVKRPALNCGS